MTSQRHIIAITLQNESGALTRVAGLFSTRGYNIESLNVAATDDPTVSRLTLVTTGNDAVIHQITQQSLKLVDVVGVEDVTREEHFERELLLIKVKASRPRSGRSGRPLSVPAAVCSGTRRTASRSNSPAVRPTSTASWLRSRTSAKCSKWCAAARSRSRRDGTSWSRSG